MTSIYQSTHVVQITDTTDRNAYLKIRSAYARHAGAYGVRDALFDIVPARNTLDIGVVASELVHNTERPDRLLLALNCAPAEKEEGTTNNHRKDFFYADLGDGIFTGGTLGGLELSYLKPRIKALFQDVTTNELNSQFRSLQILPNRIIRFADDAQRAELVKTGAFKPIANIDDFVPDVPDLTHVIEVDEPFNNVKLWLSNADRRALQTAQATEFRFAEGSIEYPVANDKSASAVFNALVRPTLFSVPLNQNGIALSSSSRVLGDATVPMIATVRKRPAETSPAYDVPRVGQQVLLKLVA